MNSFDFSASEYKWISFIFYAIYNCISSKTYKIPFHLNKKNIGTQANDQNNSSTADGSIRQQMAARNNMVSVWHCILCTRPVSINHI